MNMIFERKLTIPKEIKEIYPLTEKMEAVVRKRRREIQEIFEGRDKRLLLIIGPCSADRADSVLDYTQRLSLLQEKVSDSLLIVPRVYTNKPRTTGDGYMGMLHQPDPVGKPDMLRGIISARELYMRVLEQTGFICADELLYPENHRYFDDILAYTTVGARSSENQQHRLTASGIDLPVGMKNPISGSMDVMLNSIAASQRQHTFIYRGWEVHSQGNPLAHAVLRGYEEKGESRRNCTEDCLLRLYEKYTGTELKNPAVIVDANHSNSGKNPLLQPEIIFDVQKNREKHTELKGLVKGFMAESYLVDGRQEPGDGVYGKSITDACLGWEKTEKLITELAERV